MKRIAAIVIFLMLLTGPAFGHAASSTNRAISASPHALSKLTAYIQQPAMDSILRIDPSLLAVPAPTAWTDMNLSVQKVDPGASFTTDQPWYTVLEGPQVLMVLDGTLDIQVAGPALFYPFGNADRPQSIRPGALLHLSQHDAVVYVTKDSVSGSNTGRSPMIALVGLVGRADPSVPGSNRFPENVDVEALDDWKSTLDLTSDAATVSLLRLTLAPLETAVFDPDPTWRCLVTFDPARTRSLRVFDGVLDSFDLSGGHASWKLQTPGEGPHTLANLGEEPIDLYFMVVEEDSDAGIFPA